MEKIDRDALERVAGGLTEEERQAMEQVRDQLGDVYFEPDVENTEFSTPHSKPTRGALSRAK